jgi:hypothetical protein
MKLGKKNHYQTSPKMKTTSLFGLLQKFTTQIFGKQKLSRKYLVSKNLPNKPKNELLFVCVREKRPRTHRNGVNRTQCVHLIANEPLCIALHVRTHAHWPHDWNSETSLALAVAVLAAAAVAGRPAGRHARKGNHAAVQPFMGGTKQLWPGQVRPRHCSVGSAASANSAK